MIFDLAVIGTKELKVCECRHLANKEAPDIYRPFEGEIMAEIRPYADYIELTMITPEGQIKQIHSKALAFTTYTTLRESSILSDYEVLWAAGVCLDPVTLCPGVTAKNETSIKNIYYYGEKRAAS